MALIRKNGINPTSRKKRISFALKLMCFIADTPFGLLLLYIISQHLNLFCTQDPVDIQKDFHPGIDLVHA